MKKIWDEGGGYGEIPIRHLDLSKDYVHMHEIKECKNYKLK